MEEKLIVISIDDETVDSFIKVPYNLGIYFYCVHNNLQLIDVMEFEAFVFVDCIWR